MLSVACLLIAVSASAGVIGTEYRADTPFPQFMHLWQEGWSFKDAEGNTLIYARPDMPLGGYVFVYFQNGGKAPIKITDLTVQGIKLSEALGVTETPHDPHDNFGSSILLSKLPREQIELLKSAGTPVWWKAEPQEVPVGGFGEIVLRLKRSPTIGKLDIGVIMDKGTIPAGVPIQPKPHFATISFSPDLDAVYLYARHPKGLKPVKVFLDGNEISVDIAWDKSLDIAPIMIKLPKPLKWMSYHNFRVTYADGSSAMAGIRAWGRDMVYGMWGASLKGAESSEIAAKRYLNDWALHNINVHMGMSSGPGHDFFGSPEGWKYCESLGIGRMTTWDTGTPKPVFFFVMDEPDAHDAATGELEPQDRLGSLGQYAVRWAGELRRHEPDTPLLLNIDNTYKPENWYMYHQLADIPCIDPYYPEQLDFVYRRRPDLLAVHSKPTYVYATSTISQSSCQPKPLHVLLCSTKYRDGKGYEGRYPTPEEKRMEVYYAIAAGAKGLSYWWFSPDTYCRGCGSDDPEALALWREIGLLGAEVRTAGPIITKSCPVALPVTATPWLWVRTLLSASDTIAVIVVNDDVACDRVGTVYKPVEKANVKVKLPSWLKPTDAFEITFSGTKDVSWAGKSEIALDLGTVQISRFVLITSDPKLRSQLQGLYESKFAANVGKLVKAQ
jgi:hypothetical protein